MTSVGKPLQSLRIADSAADSDHPIGHPIGSTTDAAFAQADATHRQPGLANDGAPRGTPQLSRRTGATDVAAIAARLSDRDRAIMRSVADHQFLTGHQVTALHFWDHTAISGPRIARRVLARLRELRVLGALERPIGGVHAGSGGLVHYVDTVGDQLLRGRNGRTARRSREPSARFLAHRLAVADTHITLREAHRRGELELVECRVEPASWRQYTGAGGARLVLKSDLSAETGAGADYLHGWFIEVDLGTESIPTLLRKCHAYEGYRRSGTEQDRTGSFPVVVWSVTHQNEVKAENRRAAFEKAVSTDRNLPPSLFRIIAPEQLIPTLQRGGQQ